ncbi:MAG TPA: GDSL-type esterase/lipase family protein [Puia sp.]|nr:GDSL-type esterase/lipase family protein [Puia sp.]
MRLQQTCYLSINLLFLALFMGCQKNGQLSQPAPEIDTSWFKPSQRLTGVGIGNSIIAGHPWRYSGLEQHNINLPDSFGQICYHLALLTNFQWFDRGWGGQTTGQIRARFLRDALAESSDPGDGDGPVTLKQKPDFVVLEGVVNDIAALVPMDSIEGNFIWMSSMLYHNHIRCIALNCVGQGYNVFNSAQLNMITQFNHWLASGDLDSLDVTVIDINSFWNSGVYGGVSPWGNDNLHFSSFVDSADGVHFTQAGYDSVAHIIFRVAGLPGQTVSS